MTEVKVTTNRVKQPKFKLNELAKKYDIFRLEINKYDNVRFVDYSKISDLNTASDRNLQVIESYLVIFRWKENLPNLCYILTKKGKVTKAELIGQLLDYGEIDPKQLSFQEIPDTVLFQLLGLSLRGHAGFMNSSNLTHQLYLIYQGKKLDTIKLNQIWFSDEGVIGLSQTQFTKGMHFQQYLQEWADDNRPLNAVKINKNGSEIVRTNWTKIIDDPAALAGIYIKKPKVYRKKGRLEKYFTITESSKQQRAPQMEQVREAFNQVFKNYLVEPITFRQDLWQHDDTVRRLDLPDKREEAVLTNGILILTDALTDPEDLNFADTLRKSLLDDESYNKYPVQVSKELGHNFAGVILRVIHNAESYEGEDPHSDLPEDRVVQHVTIETLKEALKAAKDSRSKSKYGSALQSLQRNSINNFFFKYELEKGTLIRQQKWIDSVNHVWRFYWWGQTKDDKSMPYYCAELDPINKQLRLSEVPKPAIDFSTNDIGLVANDKGQFYRIVDTEENTLPNFEEIQAREKYIREKEEGYQEIVEQIDDISALPVDELITTFFNCSEKAGIFDHSLLVEYMYHFIYDWLDKSDQFEQMKVLREVAQELPLTPGPWGQLVSELRTFFAKRKKSPKNWLSVVRRQYTPSYRGKKVLEKYLPGLIDINYYIKDGQMEYTAGEIGTGIKENIIRGPRIKKLIPVGKAWDDEYFEEYISQMKTNLVRFNQTTVIPDSFKYMREYAALHELQNISGMPELKELAENFKYSGPIVLHF